MENKKVLLMILDGWGEGKKDSTNAIYTQGSPAIDALRAKYPVSHLMACGEDVGLLRARWVTLRWVTSTWVQVEWYIRIL